MAALTVPLQVIPEISLREVPDAALRTIIGHDPPAEGRRAGGRLENGQRARGPRANADVLLARRYDADTELERIIPASHPGRHVGRGL